MTVKQRTIRWLFCDLDDTLIAGGRGLSENNRELMRRLRAGGVRIVPASGRNWRTLHQVLPPDTPVDYAVYSTGAGILDWRSGQILRRVELDPGRTVWGIQALRGFGVDFMIHSGWPDNHAFCYCAATPEAECASDFYRRLHGNPDAVPLAAGTDWKIPATQFLVILNADAGKLARAIGECFQRDFSVVRATSPMDHRSIWLEIFAPGVNKASGAEWLLENAAENAANETFALGNDHNDWELLNWADHALVMADAPPELIARFPRLACAPETALAAAAKIWHWEY